MRIKWLKLRFYDLESTLVPEFPLAAKLPMLASLQ